MTKERILETHLLAIRTVPLTRQSSPLYKKTIHEAMAEYASIQTAPLQERIEELEEGLKKQKNLFQAYIQLED